MVAAGGGMTMAHPDLESLERAAREAFAAWSAAGAPTRRTWERLLRVDPRAGFPQQSTELTEFATALFAEVVALVGEPHDDLCRVTYRGVRADEQPPLDARITSRLEQVRVEKREHGTLDFSLLAHRSSNTTPHAIRLAVESEMKPVSGEGHDPDELVPDLVKLALIDAEFKVYICRVNGGNEKVDGRSVPKWTRLRPVIESVMTFAGNRAATTSAVVLMTSPTAPWAIRLLHRVGTEAPTERMFSP
ncbi:MAG: hypothetical protein U0270_46585 [Labilithrix sp.]